MATLAFQLPQNIFNSTGWGPISTVSRGDAPASPEQSAQPAKTNEISSISDLFAPYTKADRLGRISDFTQANDHRREHRQQRDRDGSVTALGSTVAGSFTYKQDKSDDADFTIVGKDGQLYSGTSTQPRRGGYGSYRGRGGFQSGRGRPNVAIGNRPGQPAAGGQQQPRGWGNQAPQVGGKQAQTSRSSTGFGTQTTTARSGTINVSARQVAAAQRQAAYQANRNKQRQYQAIDNEVLKDNSVQIQSDWKQVSEVSMHELNAATAECTGVSDVTYAGSLEKYNIALNRVTPRAPMTLQRIPDNKLFITATTSEDPVMEQQIQQNVGTVYATDSILSILMAAGKTVHGFDIIVRKKGNSIVLDKRPDSKIDFLTVNENTPEQNIHHQSPPITDPENVNHPDNLATEATFINQCISQQILVKNDSEKHEFDEPNPFSESLPADAELASLAYRYRKFNLPGDVSLVARCTLNAYTDINAESKTASNQDDIELPDGKKRVFVISRALNEYDSKHTLDYRQRLESQTGAILAHEMKNNLAKLTRWAAEAILTGAEQVRLAFVSRANPRTNYKHQILLTKLYSPSTFAASLNVSIRSLWGTLSAIINLIKKQQDGTYVLLRDANKQFMRLYAVPEGSFALEDHATPTTTTATTNGTTA